jgi:glycosyltransferase involved in cell wall biosynthesis
LAISVIIAAYNEAPRIGSVIKSITPYVDELIVVDDGSKDNTSDEARNAGAHVIRQEHNGYIAALKRGFLESKNGIIVTIDADGEHCASDIPRLVEPINTGKADLVLGTRQKLPRLSEIFINWLTNIRIKTCDACTGFRALRRDVALQLSLNGKCTCGIFVLEAYSIGMKVLDVPITTVQIDKKRVVAWHHARQFCYILLALFKQKRRL